MILAIDGPSGVGKGTVSRALAEALGYRHIDTGAMYRAVAWTARAQGVPLDNEAAVADLAARVELSMAGGAVIVNGVDVTRAIRTPEMDQAAAAVARMPRVRAVLVDRQRALGRPGGVVMEGRDIGTVVFPDADVKIYLDASPEERARRRAADPAHVGTSKALTDVATALAARDQSDQTRAASPLTIAPDAVLVDTTGLAIDDVVARVLEVVNAARAPPAVGARCARPARVPPIAALTRSSKSSADAGSSSHRCLSRSAILSAPFNSSESSYTTPRLRPISSTTS